MARSTASWLARRELFARTVVIKVRYNDFTTITRSHTEAPTRDESSLVNRAVALLAKTDAGQRPVRLLGVSVHNLCDGTVPASPARTIESRLPFDEGYSVTPIHNITATTSIRVYSFEPSSCFDELRIAPSGNDAHRLIGRDH